MGPVLFREEDMSAHKKLEPIPGGRWAIGRTGVSGLFVSLIEDTAVLGEHEIREVMMTLRLPYTYDIIDYYFPENEEEERCPTFEFMSLWYDLSPSVDGKDRV